MIGLVNTQPALGESPVVAFPAQPRLDRVALLIQGDDDYGVGRVARETTALLPDLRCVAFCDGSERDDILGSGTPVHVLPAGPFFRGFAPSAGAWHAVRQLVRARSRWQQCARELHAWCQREGVRVLHGNVWAHYFTLGALRRMYPGQYQTIWHTHNFLNLERHFGLRGRFNLWQVRRGADWLLCVSQSVAGGWARSGVPTRVIYNCVSERHLALPAAESFLRRSRSGPLRLVGSGRMENSKGHHVTIEAVARLRDAGVDVTLDLFGGPLEGNRYVDDLRQRIAALRLGDIVQIRGYVRDFVQRLTDYHVAIQARIDPEPCSVYVIECMARGMPLVASAGGGTPELVRHGLEGRLYAPGDADDLARRLTELMRDPDGTDRMAAAARQRVLTEFSPERFAGNMRAFYGEVLAGTGRAAVRGNTERLS